MKTEQISQPKSVVSSVSSAQLDESDEGSLNLGQVVSALRRKVFLIGGITALVAFASVFKALNDVPTYSAKIEILTQRVTVESRVLSSIPDTLANSDTGAVDENILKVLTSPIVLTPIVDQLKTRYPDLKEGDLVENLTVDGALKNDSKVLVVSYKDVDPERVKAVLNAVSIAFLSYSLQSRQADVRQGIEFVEAQLPEQQKRVETLQQRLQQLRQKYLLVDPNSRGNQLSGQLSTYSQEQSDVEIQLKQLREVDATLAQQLATRPSEAIGSSALNSAPRYQSLLNDLLNLDAQIDRASILYLDNSPDMQYLRQTREKLAGSLDEEGKRVQIQVKSQIQELEARDRALQDKISSLNGDITDLSGVSRQYADIQRELQISTENLNQFLTKQAALQIDASQQKTPWELLTPPTNPEVSAESVQRNLIQGIILGLLLGTGTALMLDKLSNILHSPKEIKQITKLPLLGVIPFNPALAKSTSAHDVAAFLQEISDSNQSAKESNAKIQKPDAFVEAFRFLYTNIRRFNPDVPVRSLVVSSPISADGKSIVALCLAQAVANMGQRVLLVDADLRRPHLHRYLGLKNRRGLTDVVAGDALPGDMIRQSSLDPNLFVLTTGLMPPDPTKFLSSQKMRTLMEKSPDLFDLVIYDAPPLLGLVDTSLITPYVDGMLLVAGLDKLKSSLLRQALEQLKGSGTSVLGIVANGSREAVLNIQDVYRPSYEMEQDDLALEGEAIEVIPDTAIPVPSFLKNWDLN
jgi:polysaccharide biosynthesis transport protein